MFDDPIVEDIRRVRRAHASQFDNDLAAIVADLRRRRQTLSEAAVVRSAESDGGGAGYARDDVVRVGFRVGGVRIVVGHGQMPEGHLESVMLKFAGGAVGKTSALFDAEMPYQFNIDLAGTEGTLTITPKEAEGENDE